jgi:SIR2-like domain
MDWQQLQENYREQGIVLALGAGVSFLSDLPDWAGLLRGIARRCPGVSDQIVEDLKNRGFGLAAIASMLRLQCGVDRDFTQIVRDALYENFEPYKQRHARNIDLNALLKQACAQNYTLRAVAALCAKRDLRSRSFVRNDKIHGVINFNLDALLREYVEVKYKRALVRSVERASKSSDPARINLYYMHGFLRFDAKARDPEKEAFDKLVLTEQEYFDFFNKPTSIFNYTCLYVLREYSCLFIGLSMQDENIRRLLYYSTQERRIAYEEEKRARRQAPSAEEIKRKLLRHFAIIQTYESPELTSLVEGSLAELGTSVLWVSDYDEIPARLKNVYGPDWTQVYFE